MPQHQRQHKAQPAPPAPHARCPQARPASFQQLVSWLPQTERQLLEFDLLQQSCHGLGAATQVRVMLLAAGRRCSHSLCLLCTHSRAAAACCSRSCCPHRWPWRPRPPHMRPRMHVTAATRSARHRRPTTATTQAKVDEALAVLAAALGPDSATAAASDSDAAAASTPASAAPAPAPVTIDGLVQAACTACGVTSAEEQEDLR